MASTDPRTTTSRLIAGGVWFTLHVQRGEATTSTTVMAVIERDGHVEVQPLSRWHDDEGEWRQMMRDRRDDMVEALIDAGLADYHEVAPGERELYAEDKLLDLLSPALNSMPRDTVLL